MPVRPPLPSGCSTTPGSITRSVKCTKAPPRWTGWCRSRSAASRSRRPRPPVSGATIGSISSIRPDTSISRSRSSAPCACSTARWRCSARSAESSRSPRPCGARPTSIAFRASRSSTRWTAWAPTSSAWSGRSATSSRPSRCCCSFRSAAEEKFTGVVDLVENRALIWDEDRLGAKYRVEEIPAELKESARGWREKMIETLADHDERIMEMFLEGKDEPSPEQIRKAIRRRHAQHRGYTGPDGLGLPQQGRAADARRGGRLSAVAARRSAGDGQGRRQDGRALAARRRAVQRARVQDHDRPVCRHADLLARLLGTAGERIVGAQFDQAEARAHRTAGQDARQQARGDYRGLRRRHLRGRTARYHHRRHAVRPGASDRARVDRISRAGHLRSRSSPRPRPTRKSSASRCPSSRARIRRSA